MDTKNNLNIMLKEIDLIQACITRMATNSFFIKGWSITVIAACVTLATKDETTSGYIAAIISGLAFWWLDAFYLRLERMYRRKYEWVIARRGITLENAFDLNPANKKMWITEETDVADPKSQSVNLHAVQWSPTLRHYYLSLLTVPTVLLIASNASSATKAIGIAILIIVSIRVYADGDKWE